MWCDEIIKKPVKHTAVCILVCIAWTYYCVCKMHTIHTHTHNTLLSSTLHNATLRLHDSVAGFVFFCLLLALATELCTPSTSMRIHSLTWSLSCSLSLSLAHSCRSLSFPLSPALSLPLPLSFFLAFECLNCVANTLTNYSRYYSLLCACFTFVHTPHSAAQHSGASITESRTREWIFCLKANTHLQCLQPFNSQRLAPSFVILWREWAEFGLLYATCVFSLYARSSIRARASE